MPPTAERKPDRGEAVPRGAEEAGTVRDRDREDLGRQEGAENIQDVVRDLGELENQVPVAPTCPLPSICWDIYSQ